MKKKEILRMIIKDLSPSTFVSLKDKIIANVLASKYLVELLKTKAQ